MPKLRKYFESVWKLRNLIHTLLMTVLVAAIVLIAFLLSHPFEKERLATITGLLAVITAVISAFPALRVLELQDDSSKPRPIPYFDLSGRHQLIQLRVKNIGPNVAYDVRLKWKNRPFDYKGQEVTELDEIPVLLPEHSVSINLGSSSDMVQKYSTMRFEGEATFNDASGKKLTQQFVCSTHGNQGRLTYDEELPKTLYELQKIPEKLEHIDETLNKIRQG